MMNAPAEHVVHHLGGPLDGHTRTYPGSEEYVGDIQVADSPDAFSLDVIVTRACHYKPTGRVENGVEFWEFSHYVLDQIPVRREGEK